MPPSVIEMAPSRRRSFRHAAACLEPATNRRIAWRGGSGAVGRPGAGLSSARRAALAARFPPRRLGRFLDRGLAGSIPSALGLRQGHRLHVWPLGICHRQPLPSGPLRADTGAAGGSGSHPHGFPLENRLADVRLFAAENPPCRGADLGNCRADCAGAVPIRKPAELADSALAFLCGRAGCTRLAFERKRRRVDHRGRPAGLVAHAVLPSQLCRRSERGADQPRQVLSTDIGGLHDRRGQRGRTSFTGDAFPERAARMSSDWLLSGCWPGNRWIPCCPISSTRWRYR